MIGRGAKRDAGKIATAESLLGGLVGQFLASYSRLGFS